MILTRRKSWKNFNRWIFISPHFDDAVLSCGGLINRLSETGTRVEIWTVNGGIPEAGPGTDLINRIHAVWKTGSPEETVRLRRIEDKTAAEKLGAAFRHLDNIDAIYRRNALGDYLYTTDVFAPIHPEEADITAQCANTLRDGLEIDDLVICPLALGGHVDHVISRQAVELLLRPVLYYADIPYLFRNRDSLLSATINFSGRNLKLRKKDLAAWQAGIALYKSQLPSLFIDENDMVDQITNYWNIQKGITLWNKR